MAVPRLHEAIIEVRKRGDDHEIRLIDLGVRDSPVPAAPAVISTETLTQKSLHDGWDDLTMDGHPITPDRLCHAFAATDHVRARQSWGSYLTRLLTPSRTLGACWDQLRSHCDQQNEELATLLDLPADWQRLPWELIHHNGSHLSHHQCHTVGMRTSGTARACEDFPWPLRILVVIGCKDDDQTIGWKEEEEAIRYACSSFSIRVDLTIVGPGAGKQEVEQRIKQIRPHIFHFIGHGTASNGGALLVHDELWKRDEIHLSLTANEPPRLAIINACQSAGEQGDLNAGSTADAFADVGAAAVVAMRGDIRGSGATTLSKAFYRELSEWGVDRIDKAFARAVGAIVTGSGIDERTWALPRIYFQDTISTVFPSANQESRGFKHAAKHDPDLQGIMPFVNCTEQRAEIYQRSDAWLADEDPAHRLLLIVGKQNAGKTWLLKALNYVATLRNFKTLFWRFDQKENYDLNRFLNILLDHSNTRSCFRGSLIDAGLEGEAFENFRDLCNGEDRSSGSGDENSRLEIMKSLRDVLSGASQAAPLVVFFDQIERFLSSEWNDSVVSGLISPISKRMTTGDLRVIVTAKENDLEKYGLSRLPHQRLVLDDHSPEKFYQYALDYFFLLNGERVEQEKLAIAKNIFRSTEEYRVQISQRFKLNDLELLVRVMGASSS